MSDGPVLLYDGECGLCDRAVQFVLRHERGPVFRFAPLQGAFAKGELARLGVPPTMDTVCVVEGARAWTKSRAVRQVLARLAWPWRLLGWLGGAVPEAWADGLYDFVAARRTRVFGRLASCRVPGPETRARFMLEP